ncbi:MAG: ABC transporter permease [Clostridiaceae bacterium]|nr:ABC transporter permease [Clostridiaceae bacterium]
MAKYISKKVVEMLITILLIVLIVFIMFELIPGNPARIMLGMNASNAQVAALEEELGYNQSIFVKIYRYFTDLMHGDLGFSFRFQKPVATLIKDALPYTLFLALYAFIFLIVLAVPLAILSAHKPNSIIDKTIRVMSETCLAIPPFFMAIILMLVFKTSQLALQGGNTDFIIDQAFKNYWMPALAIALSRLAMAMEFLRDAIIEQRESDYVKTAIGKGASRSRLLFSHVLRNSLVPFITVLGLILAEVFSGSIIIEQVFLIPGLGRILVTAVEARDFRLTQGIILLIAFIVVFVNFLVDFINQFIDPRMRQQKKLINRKKNFRIFRNKQKLSHESSRGEP